MSQRGSNSAGTGPGGGEATLVTTMVAVGAVFLVATMIILQTWLQGFYGKWFWEIGK